MQTLTSSELYLISGGSADNHTSVGANISEHILISYANQATPAQ